MPNLEAFEKKISSSVNPGLSAKEMAERIVLAALETEYGRSFTLSRGFAKMVNSLAEVVVTNPELRRQALHLASVYIKKNRDSQKDTRKGT